MLKVTDLTYRYPNGTLALDQVSFQIQANEKLAIIGRSQKSTNAASKGWGCFPES
jgi:ABC-type multidrug transport system fused ATPase/permease subunit